jgi:hypothetical protein
LDLKCDCVDVNQPNKGENMSFTLLHDKTHFYRWKVVMR